jgi:glyoxylase-like metal-dependent hydrolase (beta-lactamase superfamily II)
MRIVSTPGLLICLCTAAVSAADYAPATIDMELKRVSEHVYYVEGAAGIATENQGFISNASVIVTEQGVVVFDALGTPSLADLLVKKIRAVTDQPIAHVIVSHYHADHVYGLQVFEELGAEIWAPQGAQAYLDSAQAEERLEERRFSLDPWVNDATRLVAPDRYLSEPEQFTLGKVTFKITPVGGAHSDADLTVYVEPDRVLLSGDLIFEGRVPFLGDANSAQWLAVLESMTDLGVAALVPGHGPAAADPNAAVTLTRDYLAYLRDVMGAAVENFQSFDEAYAQADWSRFEKLPAFEEANRRNAYQVFLSMEAEALGQ